MDRAYAKLDLALEKAAERMDLDEFEPNNDYERNSEPEHKPPFQPTMVKEPTATASNDTANKAQSAQQIPGKKTTPASEGKPTTNATNPSLKELDARARHSEIQERLWREKYGDA